MERREIEEKRNIMIDGDAQIEPGEHISLHITYDRNLTLKELVNVVDATNKAINDVNRANGISNQIIGKNYTPVLFNVKSGSIVLEVVVPLVATVPLSVLGNFIYDRLKDALDGRKKEKKRDKDVHDEHIISITVDGRSNNYDVTINHKTDNNTLR